jgi:hypothetical protein
MNIRSTKQSTVRTGTNSITQPFLAKQLQELASEEEPNIHQPPQSFIVEKHQELPEGKAALLMDEASFISPPVSNDVPEEVSQQRLTRGQYPPSKILESSASRVFPIHKSRMDRKIVRTPLKNNSVCRKQCFLLLMLLSILGVVQAQADCQIMIDWILSMFSGSGTACCTQIGITFVWDRITEMYFSY